MAHLILKSGESMIGFPCDTIKKSVLKGNFLHLHFIDGSKVYVSKKEYPMNYLIVDTSDNTLIRLFQMSLGN